jgi:hypothetical protein
MYIPKRTATIIAVAALGLFVLVGWQGAIPDCLTAHAIKIVDEKGKVQWAIGPSKQGAQAFYFDGKGNAVIGVGVFENKPQIAIFNSKGERGVSIFVEKDRASLQLCHGDKVRVALMASLDVSGIAVKNAKGEIVHFAPTP